MYLKNLTLRGFKSFASATNLRLEPGITCVVGPNGSGKSNVVDALAWVMGEQGAKSLRGGKMEDVIFAGTSSRPALGRAEVSLTIDNSDGALPIDYSEVTIRRTLFRNGGSEYAINGDTCRLLDVQELLSDSGIGREMHVVVGQGQLDAVLHQGAEARRSLIEESAGILKHRKRKEKALRKIEAMQGNLDRLTDLTSELRRQLKPLGKQAEIARKAATIQADLRDARLRLLADDITTLRERLAQEEADEAALRERRDTTERELNEAKQRESVLEQQVTEAEPHLRQAQQTYHHLSRLSERLTSVANLAEERQRGLREMARAEPEGGTGRDPDQLEREAAEAREQEQELTEQLTAAREELDTASQERAAAESAHQAEQRRISEAARAQAEQREELVRLQAAVESARSRVSSGDAEMERLASAATEARERAETAQQEYAEAAAGSEASAADTAELDAAHEDAQQVLAEAETALGEAREAERAAERERAALAARKEALELGLDHRDGAAALREAEQRFPELLGPVAALVQVESGAQTAVAAALGTAADALAMSGPDAAVSALDWLRSREAGRAGLVIADETLPEVDRSTWPTLPEGLRYAVEATTPPDKLRAALTVLLDRMVLVSDTAQALRLLRAYPDLHAVTPDGDVVSRTWAIGGAASAPSLLETQAAVDEAAEQLAEAERAAHRAAEALEQARQHRETAAARVRELAAQRKEIQDRSGAVARQLGTLESQAKAAAAEAERYTAAMARAEQSRDADAAKLAELEERLAQAEDAPQGDEAAEEASQLGEELAEQAAAARARETEARLMVRTAEERQRAIAGRADSLEQAAQEERREQERSAQRRRRRAEQERQARDVAEAARIAIEAIQRSLEHAEQEHQAAEQAGAARNAELSTARTRVRDLSVELEKLVNSAHGSEMARAERRSRLEALETKAVEELGIEVEPLLAEYGPSVPIPPEPDAEEGADGEPPVPIPYVREVQERRAKDAERKLKQLGKVNPLALEEYAAMEERHAYLSTQLEDLKQTRRDLQTVVKDVDDRVQQVFSDAYADVSREFTTMFSRLFPGGEGRLVLTEPEDMLNTGVEVEARPPGKKVKRLSLLSGGERSLTAVAFLAAIFKARPSPFYVLDEVEAALDDTNLQRLLVIFDELRAGSQLIVITHQKRTMEAADVLYGVTMQQDGISHVISQRLERQQEQDSSE
ncbi:chromosome segregation protein SMC [Lipingzhangella sp. LS1_29]|uniref:Chromosome partition protein Smc n=1 Tax=Lipingzhangella rawalii TaxID=2055835 RepID=A0ABU2H5R9_9ACTN|nr:chromosome segregation protein SMC [Lipingzhangella rawalii]MDS1270652.1 chromosome segregation protein SMC [Lipingzhangella rawalii]